MTTQLNTEGLDALIAMLQAAQRGLVIEAEGLSRESEVKLRALKKQGRDLFEPTRAMQQSIARFMQRALSDTIQARRLVTIAILSDAGAQGAKAHVLLQSREGGQGHFKKLSDKYAEHKRRKYGTAPITQATKALYGDLARARWVARRK